MSEPCAFPRPRAVYLASEVISYCKAKRDVDVTPYLKRLRVLPDWSNCDIPEVLCVNPNSGQLKLRELKDVIYDLFGANVYILWDLDGAAHELMRRKSHHDLAAFVAETLDEMEADGVALSVMAQYLLKEVNQSLPINYRKNWRMVELPLKQALAQSLADLKEQTEQET